MKVLARYGNSMHAPENSKISIISSYTAGADIIELNIEFSKDHELIVCRGDNIQHLTGTDDLVSTLDLSELQKLDFSEGFILTNSPDFVYYKREVTGRRLVVETLPRLLRWIPEGLPLLFFLTGESIQDRERRNLFIAKLNEAIDLYGSNNQIYIASHDRPLLTAIRLAMPLSHLAILVSEAPIEANLATIQPQLLICEIGKAMTNDIEFNALGLSLKQWSMTNRGGKGIIFNMDESKSVFDKNCYDFLKDQSWVWAISTTSLLRVNAFTLKQGVVIDESFNGKLVNRNLFALGYAKANSYGNIYQDDGIHVEIKPFDGDLTIPTEAMLRRLYFLDEKLTYTAKDWSFYSGGGLGVLEGIAGDFTAEVEYSADIMCQATTLEMALINVDPGTHQPQPPQSFRNKCSFFDPHGAPPFVGVEHDENDGYRINWNFGAEYDNNQYGRPVGNGWDAKSGRLKIERRGHYFSAYYRNTTDAGEWACVGVVRNESMNNTVFIRCAGKRWRQENPENPDQYMSIVPNHFIFKNLKITKYV